MECPRDGPLGCPGTTDCYCFCELSFLAQSEFFTMGLVLIGVSTVLTNSSGHGLVSLDSHLDIKHFFKDTKVLILVMRYSITHMAIRDIPEKVKNNTNHKFFSLSSSWTCLSVARFNRPLQPLIALSRASFHILLECTLLNLFH